MWCFQGGKTAEDNCTLAFVGRFSAFISTGRLLSCWRQTLLRLHDLTKSHGPRREEELLAWGWCLSCRGVWSVWSWRSSRTDGCHWAMHRSMVVK
jgi:hypothetical protein